MMLRKMINYRLRCDRYLSGIMFHFLHYDLLHEPRMNIIYPNKHHYSPFPLKILKLIFTVYFVGTMSLKAWQLPLAYRLSKNQYLKLTDLISSHRVIFYCKSKYYIHLSDVREF